MAPTGSNDMAKPLQSSELPEVAKRSVKGYVNLIEEINMKGLELLNADSDYGLVQTLFSTASPSKKPSGETEVNDKDDSPTSRPSNWIISDSDAQLMLFIPFKSVVKVSSIEITSVINSRLEAKDDETPARPCEIKLFINRTLNLSFDEGEEMQATQAVTLAPSSWDAKSNTAVIESRFVNFQKITSLVVFVVNAEKQAEKTRIDRIQINGEAGEKRTMGKLKKIEDGEEVEATK